MACPTCNHAMENLTSNEKMESLFFICPRCGTVIEEDLFGHKGRLNTYVPKLVSRCRKFEKRWKGQWMPQQTDWISDGIAESINLPDNRPKKQS